MSIAPLRRGVCDQHRPSARAVAFFHRFVLSGPSGRAREVLAHCVRLALATWQIGPGEMSNPVLRIVQRNPAIDRHGRRYPGRKDASGGKSAPRGAASQIAPTPTGDESGCHARPNRYGPDGLPRGFEHRCPRVPSGPSVSQRTGLPVASKCFRNSQLLSTPWAVTMVQRW